MQALILVGGQGTRLRPLTSTLPKPVVPLADRPFLGYMIDWLAAHGVDDVVLACGFRADGLRATLGEGTARGVTLHYVEEPEPRGTAGAIKECERFLTDRFLVLNGDVLTDLDLTALIAHHREAGAVGTLGLYPVEDPSAYGLVRRCDDGQITEFLEKPSPDQIDTDEISAGMYVLEQEVLEMIPPGVEFSIERQVFPRLVGNGLHGVRLEGYWLDIGTPETYLRATWDILERSVHTEVGERLGDSFVFVEPGADVSSDARLVPPALVGADAHIGPGARVGPLAVVGRASDVAAGAEIERSVLHPACRVGEGAHVRDAICASGTEIGPGSVVEGGAILGEGVRIGAENQLDNAIRVFPGVTLPDHAVRFGQPEHG